MEIRSLKPQTFAEWSEMFKTLRCKKGAVQEVVDGYRSPAPGDWKRGSWKGRLGYRKNSHDGKRRGEQVTEELLLGSIGTAKVVDLIDRGMEGKRARIFHILTLYHNLPLTTKRIGQVIADAFGIVRVGDDLHPLMVEVKETDKNPWYALVECLQQVKLARSNELKLRSFWSDIIVPEPKGAWGLIVAPQKYYEKNFGWEDSCRSLLKELKDKTEARIAFADTKDIGSGILNLRLSNWV